MQLTDFTLYDAVANANVAWSAVNNAGGTVYEVTQTDGVLDCIWTSSWNNLINEPPWVTNLGSNGPNVLYALYNALASGIIYKDTFASTAELPTTGAWTGYVPRITGVHAYNFEIFFAGAMVINDGTNQGLGGLLTGQDMIDLLDNRLQADALMNPYMLELLRTQEVSPAYLYPPLLNAPSLNRSYDVLYFCFPAANQREHFLHSKKDNKFWPLGLVLLWG
ncbi:hypothetical protein VU10_03805 [Desulfobulbus sp. US1]|nr:hypothetical protein [Desulfobulbus sp. N2]MCW5209312.1 hypothetical protein [Desulfobulbus sp. US1]MCW5213978.1 hypothetical protein [Desulfobulbus sp. US5]WLE95303.1 MAG: hypothetical protein QTN59_11485 [Candidatus Electrothrix communis]